VVPPDAATELLYAAPTVPADSEVVVMVRILGVVVPVGVLLELHPAKYPREPSSRPVSRFRIAALSLCHLADRSKWRRRSIGESNAGVRQLLCIYIGDAKSRMDQQ